MWYIWLIKVFYKFSIILKKFVTHLTVISYIIRWLDGYTKLLFNIYIHPL